MKILILGRNGMAGHMIAAWLTHQGHDVVALGRDDLDVEDPAQVQQVLSTVHADFVINAVGLLVRDSLARPDRAVLINSWLPHRLEQQFRDTRTRVIHLSTDCVFDGARGNYKESDPPTEINMYGRSKALGEIDNDKDITFRMSIVGPELKSGTGLMNWLLTNPNHDVPGWTNAWWNGITTLQLAKCIDQYIQDARVAGIYHLVNNSVNINKYDLLKKINDVYQLGKNIVPTQAAKDINKILVDTRKDIDFGIPDYDQQLSELRQFDPLTHVIPTTTRS